MNKKNSNILGIILCCFVSGNSDVAMGASQPITTQSNNGPNGVFNNNTGSGSQYNFPINYLGNYQNNVQSIGMQVNNYNFSPAPAPRENKRDRLAVYQERYLIVTNPTELSVNHVELIDWVGDTEPFLTVTVENKSNIPAEKLSISLLKPSSNNRPSETIKFRPSNALIQGNTLKAIKAGLFLPQKQSLWFPIGSKTQLLENVVEDIPLGYRFLGVGDKPKTPSELCDEAYSSSATELNSSRDSMETRQVPLAIALKYDTIFDQHLVRLFPLYLYFGRCYSQAKKLSNNHSTFFQR